MNEKLTDEKKVPEVGSGITPDEPVANVSQTDEQEIAEVANDSTNIESAAPAEEPVAEPATDTYTDAVEQNAAEAETVATETITAEQVNAAETAPEEVPATDTVEQPAETPAAEEPTVAEEVTPIPENVAETSATVKAATSAETTKTEDVTAVAEAKSASENDIKSENQSVYVSEKEEIISKLADIVVQDYSDKLKIKAEALRQAYYRLKEREISEARNAFIENGGDADAFTPEADPTEDRVKELTAIFRGKKAQFAEQNGKLQEDGINAKKTIIKRLEELLESKDDFYIVNNEFRQLQQRWKEIKHVPHDIANELWKEYQRLTEKFYDVLKINLEMRDYDFKKNLELKLGLCELAEKLTEAKDAVHAYFDMQNLFQEWREIGPVAKELREEIWARFKKAHNQINKNYQVHFEDIRQIEKRNLDEKIQYCEQIEKIDCSAINSIKEWERQVKYVLEIQEKWKTIGFAPKKQNTKIFERFRAACNVFFKNKSEYYKKHKDSLDVNHKKKIELCEKAEALKDSQEWETATEQLKELQKEWKTVGASTRRFSEAVWKRFTEACDYFFQQKSAHFLSNSSAEVENLRKKRDIVKRLKKIDTSISEKEAEEQLRALMGEWSATGRVPNRQKDAVVGEYRMAVNKIYDRLKLDRSERRLQSFKTSLGDVSDSKSRGRLLSERDKLLRTYERLKSDIQTYENNLGFLSVASKGGGGLVKEMNSKVESLKEELNLILKKIELIDENFDKKENNNAQE
jgi:hypothetical protein